MRKRILSLLLTFCMLAGLLPAAALAAEGEEQIPADVPAVYVSGTGDDGTEETPNDGTNPENPVRTLSHAVSVAQDGATVYVMTDLTMTESARFWNKHLTITSIDPEHPVTLTRGETVEVVHDPARNNYNPAMLEVGGSSFTQEASLTLTDIILDDAGLRGGDASTDEEEDNTYFIQAASKSTEDADYGKTEFGTMVISNTDIVQDAMIATYNNTATITLGAGAVLKNYGGMSAVRISGGVLNMLDGSAIYDDLEGFTRSKGSTITGAEAGLYGPAGAVWLQGGSLSMEEGSEICDMVGRAVYADSGTVNINGTVSSIKSDTDMWQGTSGFIVHLRGNAAGTLGAAAVVDNNETVSGGDGFAVLGGCTLTVEHGAVLREFNTGNIIQIGPSDSELYFDGEITECISGGHAINAQGAGSFYVWIGPNANIHHNVVAYGTIYAQCEGGTIDIYGKINDNISTDRGGGLTMANNFSPTIVNMYEGAEICNNVSTQTGGGVMVSCGTFTMYGGTISGNISGAGNVGAADKTGGGVYVRRGGTFIMNGGEITNNSAVGVGGGIAYQAEDYHNLAPRVELNGGIISGNKMNAAVSGDAANGYTIAEEGESNDLAVIGGTFYSKVDRYLSVSSDVVLGDQNIYMQDYDFTIVDLPRGTKLGNAAAGCETATTAALEEAKLTTVVGSFWYQTDAASLTLTMTEPGNSTYSSEKPLYAAVVATNEGGTPLSENTYTALLPVTVEDGRFSLNLPTVNRSGYAVVLLQETPDAPANIITITPADITVYMGGENGYDGAVDGSGEIQGSNSLPAPGFVFTLPDGVEPTNVTFSGAAGKSWHVELYPGLSEDAGSKLYVLVPDGTDQDPVRVQFTDAAGTVQTSDTFDVGSAVNTRFDMSIYRGAAGEVTATIDETTYYVALNTGTLTVRGTTEEVEYAAVTSEDALALQAGMPAVTAPEGTVYTINGSEVRVQDTVGVSLLFDEIINNEDNDRTDQLDERANEELGTTSNTRHYAFKYLDLVDRNNGNAWVAALDESGAGADVTVYWPLPEGVTSSTSFRLLHFEGLHRDMQTGQIEDSISDCTVSEITSYTVTDTHVVFQVGSGGFSPFALVWETSSGSTGGTTRYTITASADEGGSISPSGSVRVRRGSDQGFTITAAEGYEISDVLVDGQSVGAVRTYTFENVRAGHTIRAVFTYVGVADPDDTGVSGWLDTENHGAYLQGYPGGLFGPDDNMTRAEVAQMFYNLLLDQDVERTVAFDDVSPDAWYAEAVNTLGSLGMVEGVGNNCFAPERAVTRAEFTAIAMRFADLEEGGENPFSDVSESDWFYDYVVGSTQYGWITGYTDGTFRPLNTITRAEVTAITNRMLGRAADTDYVDGHADELVRFSDLTEDYWAYAAIMEATNGHDYTKTDGVETWTELH